MPETLSRTYFQRINLKHLAILWVSLWLGLLLYTILAEISGWLTVNDYNSQLLRHLEFLTLRVWFPWVLMTPLVLWIGGRFPITPDNWLRRVPLHSAILILLSLVEMGLISVHYHFWGDLSEQMASYAPLQHIGHFLFGDSLFLFNTIIYLFFIASLNIKNFSRLAEKEALTAAKLNHRLMESQLQTLRMQINPHFLFNTLNVISVLVMKSETRQANEMINRLSRFFRHTLDESENHWVPLSKELEHIGLYLAIEKVRFGKRLTVVEDYDPDAMAVPVPSMLLQPLVENAMSHGLGEKEGPGELSLSCQRLGEQLQIIISDNGVGCDFDDPGQFREGIGIANVRARLKQMYAETHAFELQNNPQGGVIVTITLPLKGAKVL